MMLTFGVLKLLHVLTAVFWVGSSIFLANFLVPTAMRGDDTDRRFMQRLAERSRFPIALGVAGIVTVLSGLILLGITARGSGSYFATPSGLTLGLGGLCGIVAFALGAMVGALANRAGTTPNPDAAAQGMQRMHFVSRLALAFMALAIVGMTVAPYV